MESLAPKSDDRSAPGPNRDSLESGCARAGRFKSRARSEFDQWAGQYDRSLLNFFLFGPAYLSMMQEIAIWRKEHPIPFDALDIGCGTGTLASLILRSDWPATVTGLDFSPAMCAEASRKNNFDGQRGAAIAGDSEHLPFSDASFDVVTCANSFHHYPDQQAVVCEMRRVLRPGGVLVLVDGFRDNAIGWAVFDVVIGAIERDIHHAPWSEIHGLFETAGLTNIRRRKSSLLFPLCTTVGIA